MAIPGPAPKARNKRARRNKDTRELRIVDLAPAPQPELPTLRIHGREKKWPEETIEWWKIWGDSALSDGFTAIDWWELAITAMFHARVILGSADAASEYRLRVSKFGATPEDRAKLRISSATADVAERKAGPKKPSNKDEYKGLELVD